MALYYFYSAFMDTMLFNFPNCPKSFRLENKGQCSKIFPKGYKPSK